MVSHCIVLSLDLLLLPGCKEEVLSSSLVQEEPGPPQIKEEHEEEADVSTVTSLHWDTRGDTLSGKTMFFLRAKVIYSLYVIISHDRVAD